LYGECLVILAVEFGAAWEKDLKAEGCKIFQGTADGRSAFFVRLPGQGQAEQATEARTVYEPPPTPQAPAKTRRGYGEGWTQEENKELIKGVTLGLTNEEIAERIPGRTVVAVKQRIQRLHKSGVLPKRKVGRPQRKKSPRIATHMPTPTSTPLSTPVTTTTPAPVTIKEPFTIRTTLTLNLNVNCADPAAVEAAIQVLKAVRRA